VVPWSVNRYLLHF